MRKILYIIFIFTIALFAENSIFSTFGLGQPYTDLGYQTGIAPFDSTTVIAGRYLNWGDIQNVKYTVSFSYDFTKAETLNGATSEFDNTTISGFNLAVPIFKGHVVGISVYPYTRANTSIFEEKVKVENSFEDIYKQKSQIREGGINNASLVYSGNFGSFSIAGDVSSKFGSLYDKIRIAYYNETEPPYNSFDVPIIYTDSYQTSYLVFTGGLGVKYNYNNLTASLYGSFPLSATARKFMDYDSGEEDKGDFEDIDWVNELSFSLGYRLKQFVFTGELFYSDYEGKKLTPEINNSTNTTTSSPLDEDYNNFYRLSLKASFTPSEKKFSEYYKQITYSLGGYYSVLPYKVNDSAVTETTIFGGLDFPFNNQQSKIGIVGSVSLTGDKDNVNLLETTYRVGVVFSGGGNWWLKKERYTD